MRTSSGRDTRIVSAAAVDRICVRINGLKQNGSGWVGQCPSHEDKVASLSISEGTDGKALVYCHAGCKPYEILNALGMTLADLFPPQTDDKEPIRWPYHGLDGKVMYESVRLPGKQFKQRRLENGKWIWNMQGVERIPYRLNQLPGNPTVVVVEGEKDADRLWSLGIPATTNVGGAKKWKTGETMALKSCGVQRVIIIPDNDEPGRAHGDEVARRCKAAGMSVQIVTLPGVKAKGDVSDWLNAGHTVEELQALMAAPYVVTPGATPAPAIVEPEPTGTLWERIIARIGTVVEPAHFSQWFKPMALLGHDGDDTVATMTVGVPTEHARAWLTKHYLGLMQEVAGYFNATVSFLFVVVLADGHIDPTAYHLTDLGNAESFRDRYGNLVRWDQQTERWLVWNQHRWEPDTGGSLVRRLAHEHVRMWQQEATAVADYNQRSNILQHAMGLERSARFNTMLQELRVLEPVVTSGLEWDQDPWLVGCDNGVVDLRTGELRPGSQGDNITKRINAIYDPHAECPRWLQFVDEVFAGDEELRAYIKRAVGYSLTGLVNEQCFFMAHGTGANGKSTLLSTLDYVFADYAHTTDIRTFTITGDSVPYEIAQLVGRRLILTSEARKTSQINEQVLKNFTGGEKVEAQHKYGHPFSFKPVGKIWFAVNHQPRVEDESHGFWRRVRMIPFTRTFSGTAEDRTLGDKLRAEAAGILRWAVEGCLMWQQHGLNPPASVITATEAYQAAEDPVNEFLLDRCVRAQVATVTASALYQAYRAWAIEQGLGDRERLTGTNFGTHVSKMFKSKRGARGKIYEGIGLVQRDHLYGDEGDDDAPPE